MRLLFSFHLSLSSLFESLHSYFFSPSYFSLFLSLFNCLNFSFYFPHIFPPFKSVSLFSFLLSSLNFIFFTHFLTIIVKILWKHFTNDGESFFIVNILRYVNQCPSAKCYQRVNLISTLKREKYDMNVCLHLVTE